MDEEILARARQLASEPYTIVTIRDEGVEGEILYVATNPDLKGCTAQGATADEAEAYLDDVRVQYMAHLLMHDLPIPERQINVVYENFETRFALKRQAETQRTAENEVIDEDTIGSAEVKPRELNTLDAVFAH